ncbi:MAG: NAD(P)-dependent oxidoreductase [Candidatus Thorarchaeota archaeon]|nr:NAD(P)-dependent oxidoreductase [Candidatus Thorarchaeota archaeon]
MTTKEKVLLLGASGSMGYAAFIELWNRKRENGERQYDIVLLLRPSEKNRRMFTPYAVECGLDCLTQRVQEGHGLKIVWGDATVYEDILEAVRGVDSILCPMAFIAPAADHDPETSKAVNVTAIQYVVKAIHEVGGAEHIRLVYVGSVAETGDRLQSIHMGRVGDPLKPSIFDFYATCKIRGERAVIESGLKYWVSLRQTYIAVPDAMSLMDPIMFHQPIDTCIELNTVADAGRGLVNCLDVPRDSDFWRRVYNMGGGPSCRVVFIEYIERMMRLLGLGDYRKIMERKWFALRNFHCQFFEDSWILNEYIHNWRESIEDHYRQVMENRPLVVRLAAGLLRIPGLRVIVQRAARRRMEQMVRGPDGTLFWYESRNDRRISAFYGSYERYEQIGDWDDPDMPDLRPAWVRLSHGYDESKPRLEIEDLRSAAAFRGGALVSSEWSGDMYERLEWTCAVGHQFSGSPYLVLKAGHWCPNCLPPPWDYDEEAKRNPFFAQVWYPNHDRNERNYYPEDCYLDVLKCG